MHSKIKNIIIEVESNIMPIMLYWRCIMNEDYLNHLLQSLEKRMSIMRQQAGKSDIEPRNFNEIIETWYGQIKQLISNYPPTYYVSELKVYQKDFFNVERIDYLLFEVEDTICLTDINIV